MSYMALYRKWRPKDFDEVKGQNAVVQTLRNQIIYNRIGHAYLFCGTRGTGKTSIAKLFAKTVNCQHPIDGNPCNECDSCRAINSQSSLDVIEIDAASNNGVDSVREIREQVQYSPVNGRYKVYIIDEVHMLSIGAFNALLKTLEEPPSYVIFILATTEKHKLPITILSRCQKYDFKRISSDTIALHLAELMGKEGIDVEDRALSYIAKAADGSMRDALSLLDQCISFYLGQTLTYDNVLEVLGTVDISIFIELLRHIRQQNINGVLQIIDQMIREGRELSQFLTDFLWYLRNLLIIKDQDASEESMDMSSENLRMIKEESKEMDSISLLRYIRLLSELSNQIRTSTQKRVLLEVGFIKLCKPQMETSTDSLLQRISQLEDKIARQTPVNMDQLETMMQQLQANMAQGIAPSGQAASNASSNGQGRAGNQAAPDPDAIAQKQVEEFGRRFDKAQAQDLLNIASNWSRIVSQTGQPMSLHLRGTTPTVSHDSTSIQILFPSNQTLNKKRVDTKEHLEELSRIVAEITGKEVTFTCALMDDGLHGADSDTIDLNLIESKIHKLKLIVD